MISDKVPVVTGEACLQYIDRPIGFFDRSDTYPNYANNGYGWFGNAIWSWNNSFQTYDWQSSEATPKFVSRLKKWYQDPNKRIIGYITGYSDDGGVQIKILGDGHEMKASGDQYTATNPQVGDVLIVKNDLVFSTMVKYKYDSIVSNKLIVDRSRPIYSSLVEYARWGDVDVRDGGFYGSFYDGLAGDFITFDDANGYHPQFDCYLNNNWEGDTFWCNGQVCQGHTYETTMDANTTIEFGHIYDVWNDLHVAGYYTTYAVPQMFIDYPQSFITGNLYDYMCTLWYNSYNGLIPSFVEPDDPQAIIPDLPFQNAKFCDTVNLTSIPCNIILTSDYGQAIRYLNDGTLPFDAKLYPLDWNNLPQYDVPTPDPDEPEDNPDDIDPDDDGRDVDPDDEIDPNNTAFTLSNYNWYWLESPQWKDFIEWFWNDISAWNGFEDLIASIQGLFNDLASAVLMCRFMPVDISWIGGYGTQDETIKVGMIEKAGLVKTLNKSNPPTRVPIGEISISHGDYNAFLDLAPYSQLSLYLPMHGFIDLDINIFRYHSLVVQGIYDVVSGTLQYLLFYKDKQSGNKSLVNSFLVKIAQDIPITLQTKNDRDSAVFSNVASTVGGLIGAGVGLASGNPIGMVMGAGQGVQAITQGAQSTAPMRVMGTVGEAGGFYAPAKCKLILRRPSVQASDQTSEAGVKLKGLSTWKKSVGRVCGYGYKLSTLANQNAGLTVCSDPRITFTNTVPMQSEIDEIYEILSNGVVLNS